MTDELYDRSYYDEDGCSGYASYEDGPWSGWLCDLLIDHFHPRRVLDVGCAKGFLVGRFLERGIDARGIDVSAYAISEGVASLGDKLSVGDITDIGFEDSAFDLVICMETLEHVDPEQVPAAAQELARVSSRHVFASIPSFGFNDFGPQGIPMSPAQQLDAAAHRNFSEITLDDQGRPHHGHVTLATYRWWTERFSEARLQRLGWLERQMSADARLQRFHFNIYALLKTSAPTIGELWPHIRHASLAAGANDIRQLGGGFYHFDSDLAGRWTEREALLFLNGRGRTGVELEYMVPADLPHPLTPYAVIAGTRYPLPEAPGTWQRVRLGADTGSDPSVVLLGVERTWSPAEAWGSQDTNHYGLAWRRASLRKGFAGRMSRLAWRLRTRAGTLMRGHRSVP
ncbi:MAG: class I SAM-dependent methyltransferase [Candidatus Geothermincolia bacterium]